MTIEEQRQKAKDRLREWNRTLNATLWEALVDDLVSLDLIRERTEIGGEGERETLLIGLFRALTEHDQDVILAALKGIYLEHGIK